jgi:hypothetical protein
MGARRRGFGALPKIDYYGSEPFVSGAVSMVEGIGRRRLVDGSKECRSARIVRAGMANGDAEWQTLKINYRV